MKVQGNPLEVLIGVIQVSSDKALEVIAAQVVYDLTAELSKPGHGTTRWSYRSGKYHTASAPGEPPAPDTKELQQDVGIKGRGKDLRGSYILVGTNLPYGRWLEYGTSKIAPRPWARKVIKNLRSRLVASYAKEIRGLVSHNVWGSKPLGSSQAHWIRNVVEAI